MVIPENIANPQRKETQEVVDCIVGNQLFYVRLWIEFFCN